MKLKVLLIAAALCGTFSAVASAHHSFAGTYRDDETITLEGTIVQFSVRNPHSFINFEVTDENGNKVLWGGEWGSVAALSEGGVSRFTLKPGDHVIITGALARDSMDKKVLVRRVERPATDKQEAFVWEGRFR
jgi:uncharacterized protein YdeI (BOF family)